MPPGTEKIKALRGGSCCFLIYLSGFSDIAKVNEDMARFGRAVYVSYPKYRDLETGGVLLMRRVTATNDSLTGNTQ